MPKLYLLYFYTPSSWFQNIGVLRKKTKYFFTNCKGSENQLTIK